MEELEEDLFKCLVCGFVSDKYDKVDRHIRKEHPKSKISSIPWIHEVTGRPEKETTIDPRGIVRELSHEPFKRYFREILRQFTNKDLDELASLIDQEKTHRKKRVSKTDKSLLVP